MAQPTPYVPGFSFTGHSVSNPGDPQPGTSLDAEHDALQATLDEVLANLALIQRDDGLLANATVHPDAFTEESLALMGGSWVPRGIWATATNYAVSDAVNHNNVFYVCVTAHTSGVFAADLASDYWTKFTMTADSIPVTPVGMLTATDAQAAFEELDADLTTEAGLRAAHEADLNAHGISAFGETLVDDGSAATARATLGAGATGDTLFQDATAAAARTTIAAQQDVITTRGDIVRGSAANIAERLARGASGTYVRSDGTDTAFSAIQSADLPAATDAAQGALETATQAEMETGTATDKIVVPGQQHYHPGHPKARLTYDAITPAIDEDYGVSSVTDNGTADHTVNFTTAFANTNYNATMWARGTDTTNRPGLLTARSTDSKTTSAFQFRTIQLRDSGTTQIQELDLPECGMAFFGDQ